MAEHIATQGVHHFRLTVSNVDRAVAFYRDTLGMPFLFQFPGMAFFDLDGTRLMLVDPESRDFGGEGFLGSAPGFGKSVFPLEAVGDGAQQPPAGWQVVLVVGLDLFPPIRGGVGCRKTEHFGQPGLAVAAVVGQRLA